MEFLVVGLAIAGVVLVVVGLLKKSEAQDFSVRITVFGVYCFVVALTALAVVENEKNNKLTDRVTALEAQLAKQQPATQNTTAESK